MENTPMINLRERIQELHKSVGIEIYDPRIEVLIRQTFLAAVERAKPLICDDQCNDPECQSVIAFEANLKKEIGH
jgi:hypothetical protein